MSYYGIVAQIEETMPIAGCDRIHQAVVLGGCYIVGKFMKKGDIGILFPCDGRLSPEMLKANDLVGVYVGGTHVSGGYFKSSGKLSAQKFKGVKSDGFFAELKVLDFVPSISGKPNPEFKVGDKIDKINDVLICEKYFTEATLKAQRNQKQGTPKKKAVEYIGFKEHFDTDQLKHNLHMLTAGSLLTFTYKLHGTSGRSTNCLCAYSLPWWKKLINKVYPFWIEQEYKEVIGTRHTILGNKQDDHYYKADFRQKMHDKYFKGKIPEGYTFYYEIVGYTGGSRPIMQTQDNKKLKEKGIEKLFGSKMEYSYGCGVGECDVYVYRITRCRGDYSIEDLSWDLVKSICRDIGVKHVPEVCIKSVDYPERREFASCVFNGDINALMNEISSKLDKPSVVDKRHLEEGICVRLDKGSLTKIYKEKGFYFKCLEGIAKEDETYVDTEEAS